MYRYVLLLALFNFDRSSNYICSTVSKCDEDTKEPVAVVASKIRIRRSFDSPWEKLFLNMSSINLRSRPLFSDADSIFHHTWTGRVYIYPDRDDLNTDAGLSSDLRVFRQHSALPERVKSIQVRGPPFLASPGTGGTSAGNLLLHHLHHRH